MAGDANKNIGRQIGGNFRIVAELGGGGFGDVYKAEHIFFTNRPQVAIKLLRASLRSPKERDRFIQEAQLLNMLTHPHILPILDVGTQEDLPYLIMEYAPGGSLQDRLDKQQGQPLSIDEAITLLTQIGEALHYAHQQNIIHRDLKPDNILFNAKGEAVLADFGIAVILSSGGTKDVEGAGTPAYMAPEMFEGKISPKSDQYALGCIAYQLLTGRKPFEVEGMPVIVAQYQHAKVEPIAPTQYNSAISLHIEQAILKAMAKDRVNRHVDVQAFLMVLQAPQKSALQWFREGNMLYSHKRYEKALIAYEHALRLDLNYTEAYVNKGYTLNALERYEEALAAFEHALRLDPHDVISYFNQGHALNNLKRYEGALAAFEYALRLDPNLVFAYNSKGNTLRNLKRYEEAIAAYDQALRLDPNYVAAYLNKGNALSDFKRYEEAIAAYDQALRLDLNNYEIYNNKGNVFDALDRYEEALASFKQALNLKSNDAVIHTNVGIILNNLERYEEAIAAYDQALRLDPNYVLAYFNKGNALNGLKRYEEAVAAYDQALRLDPTYVAAYLNKGNALNGLKRYEEAVAAYDQALRLDPTYANAHHNKGVVLERLGRHTEAQQAFDRAKHLGNNG